MKSFLEKYGWFLLLLVVAYFPLFGHLEALPIRIWDEGRNAVNAYEMYKSGDCIVTTFEGKPDMWNTKPPFLAWLQVFFMKIVGVNELAIRLPSAIAALATCVLLFQFISRYFKKPWLGFLTVMVLLTSLGYIHDHVTRTGDYDAMLTFFTTASAIAFFTYLHKKENKYLYCFYLLVALGVLTKSVAALLFFPAFFIFALLQKEVFALLKNKHFYLGLLGFLIIVFGFYLLRESQNPGFIATVFENELGGRYLTPQEGNTGPFWYYYNNMKLYLYEYWFFWIPYGVAVGMLSKERRQTKLTVFVTLCAGLFFLVISFGKTKLQWYDAPLYPFLAILIAFFLGAIVDFIQSYEKRFFFLIYGFVSMAVMAYIFYQPVKPIYHKTYKPHELFWDVDYYSIGYFLREGIRDNRDFNGQKLLFGGYHAHVLFYLNILNDKGQNIQFADIRTIEKGDEIIVYQDEIKAKLEKNYIFEKLYTQNKIDIVRIDGRKDDTKN